MTTTKQTAKQIILANIDAIMPHAIAHVRRGGRELKAGQKINLEIGLRPGCRKSRFLHTVTQAHLTAAANLA